MTDNTFVLKRLRQLSPLGARLGVRVGHGRVLVWVSTVVISGQKWTRVEDESHTYMAHYEGDLANYDAAQIFMKEYGRRINV